MRYGSFITPELQLLLFALLRIEANYSLLSYYLSSELCFLNKLPITAGQAVNNSSNLFSFHYGKYAIKLGCTES